MKLTTEGITHVQLRRKTLSLPRKRTNVPWKSMVGSAVFPFEIVPFQGTSVSFRGVFCSTLSPRKSWRWQNSRKSRFSNINTSSLRPCCPLSCFCLRKILPVSTFCQFSAGWFFQATLMHTLRPAIWPVARKRDSPRIKPGYLAEKVGCLKPWYLGCPIPYYWCSQYSCPMSLIYLLSGTFELK